MSVASNGARNTDDPNKLLGLELIRFVSAIAIIVWHYRHFWYVGDKSVGFLPEAQPFYYALMLFYERGFYGVQIFWCVSGFIFFWKYRVIVGSKSMNSRTFMVLRFSRLYPLHILTLLIVLVLQRLHFQQNENFYVYQSNDIFHFILHLFFASNWGFESGLGFNGPIWSVSIEIMVYFFFFMILQELGRRLITA